MSAVLDQVNEKLPRSWRLARLDTLCDIQLGKMLSPAAKVGASPMPYLRNQNVQWGRFDLTDIAHMDFSQDEQNKFLLQKGDLLVCEGGEPGRAAVWEGGIEPCFYQKALHRLRPKDGQIDPYFLMFRLQLGAISGEFLDSHAKTTIAHLPAIRLAALEVATPSLNEQRRIASMLNEQMAMASRSAEAVTAQTKLVANLPNAFLQRRFGAPEIANAPTKRLGDLCQVLSGGTPAKDRAEYWGGKIPWVTVKDMKGRAVDSTGLAITEQAVDDTAVSLAPAGAVLVLVRGMGLAKGLPISEIRCPSAFNQDIKGLVCVQEINPAFLAWALRYRAGDILGDRQTVTHGTLKLDTESLLGVEIPVPSKDLQAEVVRQLDCDFASIDNMSRRTSQTRDMIESLPPSLLRRAFAGGL